MTEENQPLSHEGDCDYVLKEGESVWITVGKHSLWVSHILRQVHIFEKGKELGEALHWFPIPQEEENEE